MCNLSGKHVAAPVRNLQNLKLQKLSASALDNENVAENDGDKLVLCISTDAEVNIVNNWITL